MRAYIRKVESFYDGYIGTVELTITARMTDPDLESMSILSGGGEVEITPAGDVSAKSASVPVPIKAEELFRAGRRIIFPKRA